MLDIFGSDTKMEMQARRKSKQIKQREWRESKEYSGIPAQAQNEPETNLFSVGKVKLTIHVAGLDTK